MALEPVAREQGEQRTLREERERERERQRKRDEARDTIEMKWGQTGNDRKKRDRYEIAEGREGKE